MELDEMKLAWQALDQRLARQQTLHLQLFRDSGMERVQRRLRPLVWGLMLQLPLGIALMLWGISFWSGHLGDVRSMACGIAMQVFGTLAVIVAARTLAMVQGIDYAAPVLEIQRRIADLRAWRVKVEAPLFAVLGSVIWIPALLMFAQYAGDRAGVSLWDHVRPGFVTWLVLSAVVSLAVVGMAYLVLRRLGLLRWLANQAAGKAVQRAEAELDAVIRFERENG
ncbi:hypothetical protein ATSB10_17200 [Dyella thiooxydans]|uniref:Serine/threonine protein kinase n=1 Tax=Dyella thiooxydans TaxID=445710 RepID=A0A160N115_9GAMM|nr:hypothetical protein [Dyella thiooxydans]AND69174.1 hypothetical protein ATSB10_17200 [Dyella thiooxydans]